MEEHFYFFLEDTTTQKLINISEMPQLPRRNQKFKKPEFDQILGWNTRTVICLITKEHRWYTRMTIGQWRSKNCKRKTREQFCQKPIFSKINKYPKIPELFPRDQGTTENRESRWKNCQREEEEKREFCQKSIFSKSYTNIPTCRNSVDAIEKPQEPRNSGWESEKSWERWKGSVVPVVWQLKRIGAKGSRWIVTHGTT